MPTRFVTNPRRNPSDLKPGMRVGKYTVEMVRARDVVVSGEDEKHGDVQRFRVAATTLADLKRELKAHEEARARIARQRYERDEYEDALPEYEHAPLDPKKYKPWSWGKTNPAARRSRKNPSSRRVGGVEAIYMGRVAGASRAVDGDGVEYKLDPEEVSEKGLQKGDAVIVRAVPGRFAAFRKTVARKNPRKYDEGRDDAGFRKLSDLKRGEVFKRKADARKVYRKGDYDRSERKYACDDEDDIRRSIYLKGDALVYVGFDY